MHYIEATDVLEIEFEGVKRAQSFVYRDLLAFHLGTKADGQDAVQGITVVGLKWLLAKIHGARVPSEGQLRTLEGEGRKALVEAFAAEYEVNVFGDLVLFADTRAWPADGKVRRIPLTKNFALFQDRAHQPVGFVMLSMGPDEASAFAALTEVLDVVFAAILPSQDTRPALLETSKKMVERWVVPILQKLAA